MTTPLRVLIVDDEPLARARLQRLLRAEPMVDVLGECSTGLDAAHTIAALRPDVVFLDIQMPELDGFGVLHHANAAIASRLDARAEAGVDDDARATTHGAVSVGSVPVGSGSVGGGAVGVGSPGAGAAGAATHDAAAPLIVFVTAYAEHAVRAFDERALDYLLKPVSAQRLRESVARARERLSASPDRQARALVQDLLDAVRPGVTLSGGANARVRPSRFAVPVGSRLRFVAPEEIDYITAEANYVGLHVAGRSLMLRETMHAVEARLDPAEFLRIHRSRIVRIDRITDIEPLASGQYVVRLKDGTRLTSGRSYRARLQATLGVGVSGARTRERDRGGEEARVN